MSSFLTQAVLLSVHVTQCPVSFKGPRSSCQLVFHQWNVSPILVCSSREGIVHLRRGLRPLVSLIDCTIKHRGLSLSNLGTPLQYSTVLSLIPDSGKSARGMGMDPPIPGKSGMGMMGMGDRGVRALPQWVRAGVGRRRYL